MAESKALIDGDGLFKDHLTVSPQPLTESLMKKSQVNITESYYDELIFPML